MLHDTASTAGMLLEDSVSVVSYEEDKEAAEKKTNKRDCGEKTAGKQKLPLLQNGELSPQCGCVCHEF